MGLSTATPLKPRKTPRQARSTVTVAAIHEAGIQVLLAGGYARFTTTRVAERAGVSIGSLYQYYPNKQSLLAALLREHLEGVVTAVEAACREAEGQPLAVLVRRLVRGFVQAKLRRMEVSLALYGPMAEANGAAIAQAAGARGAQAIGEALARCGDIRLPAPFVAAGMLSVALAALMQAALEAGPGRLDATALEAHMVAMAEGYLRALAARG